LLKLAHTSLHVALAIKASGGGRASGIHQVAIPPGDYCTDDLLEKRKSKSDCKGEMAFDRYQSMKKVFDENPEIECT